MSNVLKTKLEPNDIIKRSKNDYNWKVISELGVGGYGAVNKVVQVNEEGFSINQKSFAMKTEKKSINKQASRLKIERNVMAGFAKCEPQNRRHFPELFDFGQTAALKWIVMTLVGPSLEKLKKKNGFSRSTALQCALQTLKAINDFHQIGFLHRDIKPANYCVGVEGKADLVYIIDFGLARKFRAPNGTIRPPRPKTKMVGTPRYCPRASHQMKELARKDDFESWFFMMFDFVDTERGVPWKGKTREKTYEMKIKVFDEPSWISSISSIPSHFIIMGEYLNSLEYASDVEAGIFRETITDYARSIHLTLKEKLDWTVAEDMQKVADVSATTTRTSSKMCLVDDNKSIGSEVSEPDSSMELRSRQMAVKKISGKR